MKKKNKSSSKTTIEASKTSSVGQEQEHYEGERLASLLNLIQRGIESAKSSNKMALPERFWYKQQFAIGVNEVTRVLERMLPSVSETGDSVQQHNARSISRKVPSISLQAVIVASDCNPKWLTKHLPSLASSRGVPVIFVKDHKGGSLRLGELVKLKTAMAIGIKAKRNAINQIVEEILDQRNRLALQVSTDKS